MWKAETRRLTPLRVGTILLYRRSYLRGKWTDESLVGNHWQFQTRACPKILVNCAYCFKKLSCDIAALLAVSPARINWQLWNHHCRWYHHHLVCQNHAQASPIFLISIPRFILTMYTHGNKTWWRLYGTPPATQIWHSSLLYTPLFNVNANPQNKKGWRARLFLWMDIKMTLRLRRKI